MVTVQQVLLVRFLTSFLLLQQRQSTNADVNMSFFGGIFAGIIAGHCYNAFSMQLVFLSGLAFFSGKRLVPIMAGLFRSCCWCCIGGVVWPGQSKAGLDALAHAVSTSGAIGQFVYGTLNRALIPVGLHHVLELLLLVWYGYLSRDHRCRSRRIR